MHVPAVTYLHDCAGVLAYELRSTFAFTCKGGTCLGTLGSGTVSSPFRS